MLLRRRRGWVLVFALSAALPAHRACAAAPSTPAAPRPAAPAAPANPADGYVIKLTRPMKVGEKYSYTAAATIIESYNAPVSGQLQSLKPRTVSVDFEATEQILAVNAQGEPTRASYVVIKCAARQGRQEVTVLQPGRVITVDADRWKSRIDIDQGGLTIQDELAVRAVVSLPPIDGASDDDCFGSDQRHKVGDTWPVRADALVRSLTTAAKVRIKKQDVTGTMKLAGIETTDGVPCIRVQGKTRIKHFFPPATDVPRDSKIVNSTFEYKFTRLLPTDPTGHCMTDSHSMSVLLKLRTDDAAIGPDILVDARLLRTVGIRRRPIRG